MGISIVIPVYNREKFILDAVSSAFLQTFTPKEVIVVNDNSSDNTATLVRENFPETKIISNSFNYGVSYSRNIGINNSKYNWVAFLDSDDMWESNKLEKQMKSVKNSGCLISHTDEVWYRNGKILNQKKIHKKTGGNFFKESLRLCLISPSSVLIHKSVFDNIGMFDESYEVCEDYEMWLRLTLNYKIDFVPEPLTIKRGGHDDQLSRKYYGMDRWRISAMIKILDNYSDIMDKKLISEVKSMIVYKSKIYANGAKKRHKNSEYEKYMRIVDTFNEERT